MAQKYVPVALRRLVRERAGDRCEYCLIPEAFSLATHWVDHIVADKHGGQTIEDNLALSCVLCNQHKGSDLASIDPLTGEITPLFNPRKGSWSEHFHRDNLEHAARAGREERDAEVFARRRAVENDLSAAHVQSQLIGRMPEIAQAMPRPGELRTIQIGGDGATAVAGLLANLVQSLDGLVPAKNGKG